MTHPRVKKSGGLFGLGARTSFRVGLGQSDGTGEQAGGALFLHAVGFALDVDDGGAVQQAVQGGRGHDGVTGEDVAPIAEGFVGCDDGGDLFFVAVADDLEQQRGLIAVESEVTDFIDDQQFWGDEHLHEVGHAIGAEGGFHAPDQIHGGEEEQALAPLGTSDTQGDGQMGFADAGRALEDDVTAFCHVAPGGQLLDEGPVNRRLEGEVKIPEALLPGQAREVQTGLDDALPPGGDLRFEQPAQEVRVGPVLGGGLLGHRIELGMGGGGADLQESVGCQLFINGTHEATSA